MCWHRFPGGQPGYGSMTSKGMKSSLTYQFGGLIGAEEFTGGQIGPHVFESGHIEVVGKGGSEPKA
jgi:hypothetical protein